MNLLDIIQGVGGMSGFAIDPNNIVIGSSDATTKQLLAISQVLVDEMADAYPWPQLQKTGQINLVGGVTDYALPADFSSYHYDTFWSTEKKWRILGPMTPQEYAAVLGQGLQTVSYDRFIIKGITNTTFTIYPAPDAGTAPVIFLYVADRPIRPKTWTASTPAAAGSYIFYNGNYYITTAGGTTGTTAPTWTSGTQSDGGVSWTYYDGVYNKFLADTDMPVINGRVLQMGIFERFAETKNISFTPRYDNLLNEEFAKARPGQTVYVGEYPGPFIYARNGIATFGGRVFY